MTAVNYFGDELPSQVFLDKYALRDRENNLLEDNPDQMHRRMAKEFARIEKTKFSSPMNEDFIYGLFKDFKYIIPQGSPMAGIGSDGYVSTSNCFVVSSPLDSYGGIHCVDEYLSQVSKRRGGVGADVSHIRPANMATTNAARLASGVVSYCERFSNTIREVGQSGRRGALMLTISVHHPEVVDFTTMKMDPTKVTGANVSVRLTDEFLQAVKYDKDYEQRWPVEGEPKFKRMVSAREVWKKIIHCAWARAEPGLFFWDRIIKESPADCYAKFGFKTISTNPCGEIPLCEFDSCRLLLLNLFGFVENPFTPQAQFDWSKFYHYSKLAQRLMDNLIDLEIECIERILAKVKSDPEPDYIKARELELWENVKVKCRDGRRTGTGITAIGDAIAACGVAYGSDESISFTERIYKTLKFAAYESSIDMAKELGAFPVWNHKQEKDCPFLMRFKGEQVELSDKTISGDQLYNEMAKHGRRNISLLTTAPAGSVSILAGPGPYYGTTSGIEPLFTDVPYTRRKKIVPGMDCKVDFVDKMGDKWTNYEVYHGKIKLWMDITGETDYRKSPYHGCTANDIDWTQRVKLQAAATMHLDHSVSSTLNLPNDVTEEKVAEIYETAWESGCKGITVYRDGCRDGVLVTNKEKDVRKIPKTDAPKRPTSLPCETHLVSTKGEKYFVIVGLLDGQPYEVMAGRNELTRVDKGVGKLKKISRGNYKLVLDDESIVENVTDHIENEQEAITRLVSASLRHGADINFIVHQLEKTRGDMHGFAKVLARTLKKYIKDGEKVHGECCDQCGSDLLIRQEGCVTCRGCGWSKCN